jgi:hypothetical protein
VSSAAPDSNSSSRSSSRSIFWLIRSDDRPNRIRRNLAIWNLSFSISSVLNRTPSRPPSTHPGRPALAGSAAAVLRFGASPSPRSARQTAPASASSHHRRSAARRSDHAQAAWRSATARCYRTPTPFRATRGQLRRPAECGQQKARCRGRTPASSKAYQGPWAGFFAASYGQV